MIRRRGRIVGLVKAAALAMTGAAAAAGPAAPEAWIAAEPDSDGAFSGYVRAPEGFAGRYELIAERHGRSGESRVRQAGAVRAPAGQATRLSRIAIGPLGTADRYVIALRIFSGDTLVAERELSKK